MQSPLKEADQPLPPLHLSLDSNQMDRIYTLEKERCLTEQHWSALQVHRYNLENQSLGQFRSTSTP